jgi:hypothetical protein
MFNLAMGTEEYAANVIAENFYSQLDAFGIRNLILKEISDHHSNETTVPIMNKYIEHNRRKTLRHTTIMEMF